jgi:hypothetical protein
VTIPDYNDTSSHASVIAAWDAAITEARNLEEKERNVKHQMEVRPLPKSIRPPKGVLVGAGVDD